TPPPGPRCRSTRWGRSRSATGSRARRSATRAPAPGPPPPAPTTRWGGSTSGPPARSRPSTRCPPGATTARAPAAATPPGDARAGLRSLYVVVKGPQGHRQLVKLDGDDVGAAPKLVDLGEDTPVRLAYDPLVRRVFLTFEDSACGRVLDPATDALGADLHP